jgi:hypothetical protein
MHVRLISERKVRGKFVTSCRKTYFVVDLEAAWLLCIYVKWMGRTTDLYATPAAVKCCESGVQ